MKKKLDTNLFNISVIDLDSKGIEHVNFNAATIYALRIAKPKASIYILASQSHLHHLQARLATLNQPLNTVITHNLQGRKQTKMSLWACFRVLDQSVWMDRRGEKGSNVQCFVFLSCSLRSFLGIKFFAFRNPGVNVIVIFHGVLERIQSAASGSANIGDRLFRLMFLWRTSLNVTYGIIGRSIERALRDHVPSLKTPCAAIDHPYIFDAVETGGPLVVEKVSFGHLGYAHIAKGFLGFLELAAGLRVFREAGRAQFLVVGGVDATNLDLTRSEDVSYAAKSWPVPQAQYAELLASITYAVFLYPADSYSLRASGAILDAIGANKPVIAMRNPYFEYIFSLGGDIGYLCDSMSEMSRLCGLLIVEFPRERYAAQQSCMADARRRFSPYAIACQWREMYLDKLNPEAPL